MGEFISQLTTSVIMSDLEQVVMTQGSSWHLKLLDMFCLYVVKLSFSMENLTAMVAV